MRHLAQAREGVASVCSCADARAAGTGCAQPVPARRRLQTGCPSPPPRPGFLSVTAVVMLPCYVTDARAGQEPLSASSPSTNTTTAPTAAPAAHPRRVVREVEAAAAEADGSIAMVVLKRTSEADRPRRTVRLLLGQRLRLGRGWCLQPRAGTSVRRHEASQTQDTTRAAGHQPITIRPAGHLTVSPRWSRRLRASRRSGCR